MNELVLGRRVNLGVEMGTRPFFVSLDLFTETRIHRRREGQSTYSQTILVLLEDGFAIILRRFSDQELRLHPIIKTLDLSVRTQNSASVPGRVLLSKSYKP